MKIIISTILAILFWSSCMANNETIYSNHYYRLVIDSGSGAIKAIEKNGINLITELNKEEALFSIRFRHQSDSGKIYEYNALQAGRVDIKQMKNEINIFFSDFPTASMEAVVSIMTDDSSPLISWNISVDNKSPYTLEHIDFPNVTVRNDLIGNGGLGRIFWPGNEGCLVDDIEVREKGGFRYSPIEFPYMGCGGIYPTATQMQYMAYYNNQGGLYMAAHDEQSHPKGIEFYRVAEDKIKLNFRLFTGGAAKGLYKMPYNMVLGVFDGDWYDASSIYRDWRESSKIPMPPKIRKNTMLPEWYFESPVIVSYPVRGKKDLGDMSPNKMYPYTNGLKIINELNKEFDNKIMALLMHWEGSAPWAPPYVWPPFGSEENYLEFVEALHKQNNLVGLYASGIGYTLHSNTDTTYNMYDEYNNMNLAQIMKVAPDGTLANNGTCAGPHSQRIGYDMCPANQFVEDVVLDQISKIVKSNTDYIQYFDQNHGGNCYMCYGTNHGHGYGPGLWQIEAMRKIYEKVDLLLKSMPNKPLIGCESAAAEGFIPYLLFSDNRFNLNLNIGTPVPAYAFVYHEYLNNFMGNQVGVSWTVKLDKNPYNYLQRLAHSFCAGDLMTIVIDDQGEIITSWGASWDEEKPNQSDIRTLIRNLSAWRKGVSKDYLIEGRMLKPLAVDGLKNIPMVTTTNKTINFHSVFMSNWQLENGSKAQVFVNYLPYKQEISLNLENLDNIKLHSLSSDHNGTKISTEKMTLEIPALNAVMLSYSEE